MFVTDDLMVDLPESGEVFVAVRRISQQEAIKLASDGYVIISENPIAASVFTNILGKGNGISVDSKNRYLVGHPVEDGTIGWWYVEVLGNYASGEVA